MTTNPLALRPREAAQALNVSPRTLHTWTKKGMVPCVRVGTGKRRVTLYPVAELQRWLAEQAAQQAGLARQPTDGSPADAQ